MRDRNGKKSSFNSAVGWSHGWSDTKKNCAKLFMDPNSKISHFNFVFNFVHLFFKLYHGGTYSIGLLEAKNEEKLKKIVYPLTRSKINSTILGANFFSFFRILFVAIVL